MDALVARAEQPFAADGSDDLELRELFELLKPDMKLTGMVTKQWQEVGSTLPGFGLSSSQADPRPRIPDWIPVSSLDVPPSHCDPNLLH